MTKKMRDYGLPDPDKVTGTPTWEGTDLPCPNCGGKLCAVKVDIESNLLRGTAGTSTYLGCPACPYASPAMMTSNKAGT